MWGTYVCFKALFQPLLWDVSLPLHQPLMPAVCSLHFQLLSCSCWCCLTCWVWSARDWHSFIVSLRLGWQHQQHGPEQSRMHCAMDVAIESNLMAPSFGEWWGFRHRGLQFTHVCVTCRGCELLLFQRGSVFVDQISSLLWSQYRKWQEAGCGCAETTAKQPD